MQIMTNDGATFRGETAAEVVRAMANAQWNAPERKVAYKAEVVHRVSMMTGHSLSVSAQRDPVRFLRFLERAGLISFVLPS